MTKADRAMKKGFIDGGATKVKLTGTGKYRRAELLMGGQSKIVRGIPLSSHLNDAAMKRKARDVSKRIVKQSVDQIDW